MLKKISLKPGHYIQVFIFQNNIRGKYKGKTTKRISDVKEKIPQVRIHMYLKKYFLVTIQVNFYTLQFYYFIYKKQTLAEN